VTAKLRILARTSIDMEWLDQAFCRYDNGDLWYPDSYTSPRGMAQAAEAIRICHACPIRQQCLEAALAEEGGRTVDGRHGIRGAKTPLERLAIHRRRTRTAVTAAA
jgi:WhiB family redox-sensing transcriptional regulator